MRRMHSMIGQFGVALGALLSLAACATEAPDQRPVFLGDVAPGATAAYEGKRIVSFQDRKFKDIVRQRTDFSCGAAAVATIFNYAYGLGTSETQVLVNMLRVADREVVRTKGFSLLDMKRYVEAIGMRGEGYQVDFETLYDLRVPVVVLLDTRGYKHFVVLRKARDGYVQIADPALGNRVLWQGEFEAAWNGVVFAILAQNYDETNILANPPAPLTARTLYSLRSPVYDAQIYDFGLNPATSIRF